MGCGEIWNDGTISPVILKDSPRKWLQRLGPDYSFAKLKTVCCTREYPACYRPNSAAKKDRKKDQKKRKREK